MQRDAVELLDHVLELVGDQFGLVVERPDRERGDEYAVPSDLEVTARARRFGAVQVKGRDSYPEPGRLRYARALAAERFRALEHRFQKTPMRVRKRQVGRKRDIASGGDPLVDVNADDASTRPA